MLFSRENRGDFWFALLGCLIIAIVVSLLITFVGSFWQGWFTPASLTLLWQSALGTFAVCLTLAILGLTEWVLLFGIAPFMVAAMSSVEDGIALD